LKKVKLHRELGLFTVTCLVVGNMIGSGVFLLPAAMAPFGPLSIFGWIITAGAVLVLATIFARFSMIMPLQGGIYAFSRKGFGDFIGFQVAWNYWISAWIGNAAIIVTITAYLSVFIPELDKNRFLASAIALSLLWLVTFVNTKGIRTAGIVQVVTTILKLIPLLVIACIGIFYIDLDNFTPWNSTGQNDWTIINGAATMALWAFIGVESATIPAGSVKNPKWTIPRATLIGTFIVACVYILGAIAVFGLVPHGDLVHSHAPYADAAYSLFGGEYGPWIRPIFAIGAIISSLGALNGWILIQGQIPFSAAQDGLFPSRFGKLSKSGAPVFGLLITSALITALLIINYNVGLVETFSFIIRLATVSILICYLYAVIAKAVLSRKMSPTGKPELFDCILVPIAFFFLIWALIGAGENLVFLGALLFFASTPVYMLIRQSKD
jgi:basic amino acid/polyamine antiporter, APA family